VTIVGISIYLILAVLCAVHAVRSGQQLYWLFILFSFPLLGSMIYFMVIYLPNSGFEYGARRAVKAATRVLDPQRELRDARAMFGQTPTAQNQMRLAAALLAAGHAEEAATNYEACLRGPLAADMEIRLGAARAFTGSGRYSEAIAHLETMRRANHDFRPEPVAVLLARSYAGVGRNDEAKAEFESALTRFGSFEVRGEYAIFALNTGDDATASRLEAEIEQAKPGWSALSREANEPVLRRLKAAHDLAKPRIAHRL
jgi:hypothetical protein